MQGPSKGREVGRGTAVDENYPVSSGAPAGVVIWAVCVGRPTTQ